MVNITINVDDIQHEQLKDMAETFGTTIEYEASRMFSSGFATIINE